MGALESGAPFIVTEYLEGEDLAERLARTGPMSPDDAIELLMQACEAVAEAHKLGIVHCDLKPANLFCVQGADGRPSIKVLDFGFSKLTRDEIAGSALGIARAAGFIGSPAYMSPEQIRGAPDIDGRADIWAIGCVLYELLVGQPAFGAPSLTELCALILETNPLAPGALGVVVPRGLEAVIGRCLERDPSKRFPSVAALATALARFGTPRVQASLDRIIHVLGSVADSEWLADPIPTMDAPAPARARATLPAAASVSISACNMLGRPRRCPSFGAPASAPRPSVCDGYDVVCDPARPSVCDGYDVVCDPAR